MGTKDHRALGLPISKIQFPQLSWTTPDHAPQTTKVNNVNMLVERIDVLISSGGAANPTVTITSIVDDVSAAVTTSDGLITAALLTTNFTTLADDTHHIRSSTAATAEFDAIPISGDVTITVDAVGAPTASFTVDIIFYGP